MQSIKGYTDINQSEALTKILNHESADMYYGYQRSKPNMLPCDDWEVASLCFPCWSLTALLNVLPDGTNLVKEKADTENEHYMCTVGVKDDIISTFGKNPVDACVDMILKLKRGNFL